MFEGSLDFYRKFKKEYGYSKNDWLSNGNILKLEKLESHNNLTQNNFFNKIYNNKNNDGNYTKIINRLSSNDNILRINLVNELSFNDFNKLNDEKIIYLNKENLFDNLVNLNISYDNYKFQNFLHQKKHWFKNNEMKEALNFFNKSKLNSYLDFNTLVNLARYADFYSKYNVLEEGSLFESSLNSILDNQILFSLIFNNTKFKNEEILRDIRYLGDVYICDMDLYNKALLELGYNENKQYYDNVKSIFNLVKSIKFIRDNQKNIDNTFNEEFKKTNIINFKDKTIQNIISTNKILEQEKIYFTNRIMSLSDISDENNRKELFNILNLVNKII